MHYVAPGLVKACYMIDNLRFSTLECFYANTQSFEILLKEINMAYNLSYGTFPEFTARPLINDTTHSRFEPENLISDLIRSMMIDDYYQMCQPIDCIYHYATQNTSLINILVY